MGYAYFPALKKSACETGDSFGRERQQHAGLEVFLGDVHVVIGADDGVILRMTSGILLDTHLALQPAKVTVTSLRQSMKRALHMCRRCRSLQAAISADGRFPSPEDSV